MVVVWFEGVGGSFFVRFVEIWFGWLESSGGCENEFKLVGEMELFLVLGRNYLFVLGFINILDRVL